MSFEKYGVSDNAVGNLSAGIGASTTTITLGTGEGSLFPTTTTNSFIATIVQYNTTADPTSGINKTEKILCTNRSTDTLTITRGFDGDTPTSFDAGDFIYLNIVSKIVEDIQDEVERLEDDKLDSDGELRTGLTAYRLLFLDSSGNETELSLGTAGQVLVSQGATSNPIWTAPTLDINGLDNVDTLDSNDKLVFYDNSGGVNKKRTAQASETVAGLVERATDSEATTGTDTTRYITPKQVKDNYGISRSLTFTRITQTGNGESAEITAGTKEILLNYYLYSDNDSGEDEYSALSVYNGSTWTIVRESNDDIVSGINQKFIFGSYYLQPGHKAKIVCDGGDEMGMIEYQTVS